MRCRRSSRWIPAILSVLGLGVFLTPAGRGDDSPTRATGVLDEHDRARIRFQDARFGLYIPWGIDSLLGKGEWVMERDRLAIGEYEKLPPRFNPPEFDAEAWVKTARDAGARSLAVLAKGHDGFGMFDSKLTSFDVIDATPYAKDPLRAVADACRKHKMPLVLVYSLLDWHHPDYFPRGETGRASGREEKGDWSAYVAYYQGQIRELCTNYGPIAGIRLDGAGDKPDADWGLDATYRLIHELQPGALISGDSRYLNKLDISVTAAAVESPSPGLNEVVRRLEGAWGEREDVERSTADVVRSLVKASALGANYCLTVAPKADGTLPKATVERLAEIGRWLGTNGESVYATRPGPFPPQDWGVSTLKEGAGGYQTIYLHVLTPGREIRLPEATLGFDARLLGTTRTLPMTQEGKRVVIRLPDPDPSRVDAVVVLAPSVLEPEIRARPSQREERK